VFVSLADAVCVALALVAELRMLSSGNDDGSALVSPTIVKSEHPVKPDSDALMPNLLESGMLFNEVYCNDVVTTLRRTVSDQSSERTDLYRWKSLGYWLCCQVVSALKSTDIFSQTATLRLLLDLSTAFLDGLHAVRQRYFVVHIHF